MPDAARMRSFIERYQALSQPVGLSADAAADIERRQDLLWQDRSEAERAILVEGLYENATPELQQRLGRDAEQWKRVDLRLNEAGLIDTASE